MPAFRIYLAHPPKTPAEVKDPLWDLLGSKHLLIDPFSLAPDLESAPDPRARALMSQSIFLGNLLAIEEADALLALVSPGSPFDPDQGVFWELGYAYRLGIPTLLYTAGSAWRLWGEYASAFLSMFPHTDDPNEADFYLDSIERVKARNPEGRIAFPRIPGIVPGSQVYRSSLIFQLEEDEDLRAYFRQSDWDGGDHRFVSYRPDNLPMLLKEAYRYDTLVLPIDDRHPYTAFLIGYFYGLKNLWTYSRKGYGLNIMLKESVSGHLLI